MLLDNKKRVKWIKNSDIDWTGFKNLPKEVQKRVRHRECKYISEQQANMRMGLQR